MRIQWISSAEHTVYVLVLISGFETRADALSYIRFFPNGPYAYNMVLVFMAVIYRLDLVKWNMNIKFLVSVI